MKPLTPISDDVLQSVEKGLAQADSQREKNLQDGDNLSGGRGGGPHGGKPSREKHSLGPVIKRLIAYAKPVMPLMVIAMIFATVGVVLTVISPDYLSKITDEIQKGFMGSIDMDAVWKLTWISIALVGGSFLLSAVQGVLMVRSTVWVSRRMRTDLDRKIDRLPLSYFDKTTTGNTLSRVTNDVDTLQQTLNNSLASIVTGILTLVGSVIMMFVTDWHMALAAILASVIGFAGSGIIMAKSQRHFIAQQQLLGALNGHIEESYTGHAVIRAFNGEANSKNEFAQRNEALYDSAWKAQFLSSLMWPLMGFIGNLGYVVVCVVGAVLVLNDTITVGVIVAFIVYVRIFTNPLGQLAEAATTLQSAAAAGTRVFELLDEPELPADPASSLEPAQVKGDVEFKNVKFGYEEGKEIIHDFSAHVAAGQKVAIVGPTGAGKTTIVNLLMHFYDLWDGTISVDGRDLKSLTRAEIGNLFAMVLQDTWTFEGTFRENVVYQAQNVSQEKLDEVIASVGLDEFVAQLPQGYDTLISEKSALSAGQKQLVTIARAMLADKPLLILDEATSSVDTRTEVLIQNALDQLTIGRTSFVIAHRLSTIKNADTIFVMKDGDIIETGSHEKLLADGGFYAELYNSQFDHE